MKVIGTGFGRTGTMSLCAALDQLGFGPCYHMLEVFKKPRHIKVWQAAADGEAPDWKDLLGGYNAGLDYPLVAFYKELVAIYPDAKVILTVRNPERWYDSTKETIYQGTALPDWLLKLLPPYRGMKAMIRATTWDKLFDGRFEERDHAIRVFQDHIAEVKRAVPAQKLLVFSVKDGWQPLCEFLGVPVPATSFPHINDRRTTKTMYLVARLVSAIVMLGVVAFLIWLVSVMI